MPATPGPLLGIDVGATHTVLRCRIGDRTIDRGGPGANPVAVGVDRLLDVIDGLLCELPSPSAVGVGVAGGLGPRDRARVVEAVRRGAPRSAVRVTTDVVTGVLSATHPSDDVHGTAPVVAVLAGTGSAIGSIVDGRIVQSGGHGSDVGDPGSGARHGQHLLGYALDHLSELPAETTRAIGDALGLQPHVIDRRRIIGRLTRADDAAARLAAVAPLLFGAAASGQRWAQQRIAVEVRSLGLAVMEHLGTHHRDADHVAIRLVGGVWEAPVVRESFVAAAADLGLGADIAPAKRPPVEGALSLAVMDGAVHRRLVGEDR